MPRESRGSASTAGFRSSSDSLEKTQKLTTRTKDILSCNQKMVKEEFPSSDMSLMPLIPTASGSLTPTDLRIMHHYATFTWNTLDVGQPGMNSVLKVVIPGLAFEHDYLLHAILGVGSLHMQRMLPDPTQARRQTDLYRARAFKEFRQALSQMDASRAETWEAALLMAIMSVVLCSQDHGDDDEQLTVVNWCILYQGLIAVIKMREDPIVSATRVGPVFQREITGLQCTPQIPTTLLNMMASVEVLDPDFKDLQLYCKTLDELAILFASLRQDGLSAALFIRVVSWPSHLDLEFTAVAKAKRPRALIILAFYLALLKLVRGLWWVEGIPDREIDAINRIVGPKWAYYMEVPLQVRSMTSIQEIASLLLR